MMIAPALIAHIGAGSIGILSGAAALTARKGERAHRAFGSVFVITMFAMAALGAYLAIFIPQRATVIVGIFTFYLVATAWGAVKRKMPGIGPFEKGAFAVVLGCALALVVFGLQAMASPDRRLDHYPPAPYFVFAGFAGLAAALDLNNILRGGVTGHKRIARHLWRMCAALLLAAFSFFLGQQKVMPAYMHGSPLLFLPEIAVIAAMVFWLFRVRRWT